MKITAASPYRENSVLSLAAGAERQGKLDSFCTTLYGASLARRVKGLPVVGKRLTAELNRRAFSTIPHHRVHSFASLEELVRIASFRLATGRVDFPASLMYWVKDKFDAAVAEHLKRHPVDAFIGMWGSCSRSFAAAGPGAVKLLNFVNSRPRYHNQYLLEFAGLKQGNGEVLSPHVEAMVEEEMRLADIILVPSQFIAEQMPEYAHKVVVEPYGVDLKQFSPGAPDPRFKCHVLTVGQISYRKGFTTLIEVAKRLPDVSFHAVGPIVVPSLLKNLPDNLKYAGLVMHGDVAAVMRSADVFLLSSFEDAFPLVTMEAMASGTPVIISDHAGTCEIVRHGVDGFVFQAGNVEQAAEYISRITGNPALREQMSQAARAVVAASHSWEQYSDTVLKKISAFKER